MSQFHSIVLTEDDVPGAKLPHQEVEANSVIQLQRWLQCRGVRSTGLKPELVQRVKQCITLGLTSIDVSIDGGKWFELRNQTLLKQNEEAFSKHDAQMDYYGKKLATCSSDRLVKVYEVLDNNYRLIVTLKGHEGPVWQVAWSHPMYGSLLATCSYDRKVIIWKESGTEWTKLFESVHHDSSVNSVSWAPHELGLMLACGASDGAVSVISTSGDGHWSVEKVPNAHSIGCNAVSWAPPFDPAAMYGGSGVPGTLVKRFVSGGCDNLVKIWTYREQEARWIEEETLDAHSDWVRDVAWAPNFGISESIIASCSHDFKVIIWKKNEEESGQWTHQVLHKFNDVVWHVSWSVTGNILAVSGGDNKVSLWKEVLGNKWVCVSDVDRGQGTDIDQSTE